MRLSGGGRGGRAAKGEIAEQMQKEKEKRKEEKQKKSVSRAGDKEKKVDG